MDTQSSLTLIAFSAIVAAVFFWLRQRDKTTADRPRATARQIAIDGTNVLFWREDQALLSSLHAVVKLLMRKGYTPIVFLDASSRHHIGDKSLNETKFAKALGVPAGHILICPARTEADAFILQFAGKNKVPVVSNDRFRDRPREARNIKLIKGRFDGKVPVLRGL